MSDENETSVKAKIRCAIRLYGQTHYNKEGSELMSGRLPPMPYKDFTDILKANGFKHDRSKGGHEVWEKTITDSISIPVHGDINGGLARRLIREHGLRR